MSEVHAATAIRLSSTSAAATRRLGALFAALLGPGDVVLLCGGLGAGKTTFVKGVVTGLGGRADEVTSPTFTLCHLYELKALVAHVDCWRLEDLREVVDLGLEEVLDDGGVALIEWGERAAPLLGRDALVVEFSDPRPGRDQEREIAIRDPSGRRRRALEQLASDFRAEEVA